MQYIEDFLHYYVEDIGVNDSNKQILESINSQCRKGIALTDRQYALVKEKLLEKLDNFTGDEPLKIPLRKIDRRKFIKFATNDEIDGFHTSNLNKQSWIWIKVRFPFHKKLIIKIDELKHKIRNGNTNYFHKKGSHTHYFRVMNDTVYNVVSTFIASNFEIDADVLDYFKKCKAIVDAKDEYIPMYRNGFINVNEEVKTNLQNSNELIKADRSFGNQYFIETDIPKSLTESIAYRKKQDYYVDPNDYSLHDVASSLHELERFPILVLVDNDDMARQTKMIHEAFSFIPNNLHSVLFRADAGPQTEVNRFITDNKLNNWVDNDTKIVYIKKNQLPKIIFNSGFKPITTFALNSYRSNTNVELYSRFNCDLMIFYDAEPSLFFNRGF
jgi:hypothetical protein